MIVRIGDVAAEAAMRWRIGRPQNLTAELRQSVDRRLDLILGCNVVRDRERTGAQRGASHVGFEFLGQPGAQHQPVHLIEDDILVLKDRFPTEALFVEAARTREIGNAERDDGDLLLHDTLRMMGDQVSP
jgi:hypothetical protein